MEYIKAFATVLLSAVLLTGCGNDANDGKNSAHTTNGSTQLSDTKISALPPETDQIIKLLTDFGDLYWGMFPLNDLPEELIDISQSISVKRGEHEFTLFKAVNGDIRTEEQFIEKLNSMLSEKMKKDFLEEPDRPFEFSDGDLYIRHRGAGGMGLGMDKLFLDSIEYPDDNTILVTVTSFGDKDNWGTDDDIRNTSTAKLIRTNGELRIDECDLDTITDFYFYREITYGNTSIDI